MALFGSPNAFLGLDLGTSSIKLVELVNRRRRIELASYAQANQPNILIHPPAGEEDALRKTASVISQMLDRAGVSADTVVAALPTSSVFSTVINLPPLPPEEITKAVHFEARDIIPAELDEMVLGWSKVGEHPHMDTDRQHASASSSGEKAASPEAGAKLSPKESVPIFVTAAPKVLVNRYIRLMELLNLELHGLEVETFPLGRSLLHSTYDSALIADLGDKSSGFHIIEQGTPRVSYTTDYGGYHISSALASDLNIAFEEAERLKIQFGLSQAASPPIQQACQRAVEELLQRAQRVLDLYSEKFGHRIPRSILVGGGANMIDLAAFWTKRVGHTVAVGDPWKGLAYQQPLESRLRLLGPTYAVAVGLAMRTVGEQGNT